MRRAPDSVELTQDDLQKLGAWDLNGRQIKNVLKMTLLMDRSREKPITLTDIEIMISMTCPKARKEWQRGFDSIMVRKESDNLVDL